MQLEMVHLDPLGVEGANDPGEVAHAAFEPDGDSLRRSACRFAEALENIDVLAGDSLTMTYVPSPTASPLAESWYLLVLPGGTSAAIHRTPEEISSLPRQFALHPSRPNPFRGSTRIGFDLPVSQHVALEVLDLQGRVVRTLVRGERPAGSYVAEWDGRDGQGRQVGAGVYIYRLATASFRAQRKMSLIR